MNWKFCLAPLGILAFFFTTAGCSDDEPAVPESGGHIGGGGSGGSDAAAGVNLVVDTFNVALVGAFIPNEAERRQPIVDALAAVDSNIVCLQEVWRQSDKELIATSVQQNFPHAVYFQHDLDTPIDDAEDQNGSIPVPFAEPPCGTTTLSEQLEATVDCLRDNCSTIPGSDEGHTTSASCAQDACVGKVITMITGSAEAKRCYACMATNLPAESLTAIRSECTTNPKAGLAFRGQSGVMLLSRHPLSNPKAHVLPGNWNRRVILSATANVEPGLAIDVFCNHLTPAFDGITYPYTGQYGNGQTGPAGWAAEQLLQAQKLDAYVAADSSAGRALILGDFNTGEAYSSGDVVIAAEAPETMAFLKSKFTLGVASNYTPQCTYCVGNAVNDTTSSLWIDHIFTRGIEPAQAIATERTFDQDVVTVEPGGAKIPLSDHYGLRSTFSFEP